MLQYIKRVWESDVLYNTKDYALPEFCPVHMKDVNALIDSSMSEKTYYFSYSSGIKNRNKTKNREMLKEPKKLSDIALGFDLDVERNMTYTEDPISVKERPRRQVSIIDRVFAFFKVLFNVVSINNKVFYENQHHIKCPAGYLNNLLNSNMNNVMSLDYANKDITDDSDFILPRWTQEYPKLASYYQSKDSKNKPWGQKSDPIYFDWQIDSSTLHNFDKGIWYYSSLQLSDHHDLAGFPNKFWVVPTVLG